MPACQRGSPWRRNRFNVAGAPGGRLEASLQHFGVDKPATGGHYDLVILDDLVNHINSSSPDGIAKVKACFRQVSPLLVNGGQLIVLGTRYADDDLYGWILREMADVFRVVTFDAGCDVVLHCNGDLAEMKAVAVAARPLNDSAMARVEAGERLRLSRAKRSFDEAAAKAELDAFLAA